MRFPPRERAFPAAARDSRRRQDRRGSSGSRASTRDRRWRRSSAFSAISKYASISSGESCSVSRLFRNPSLDTASGGSTAVKSLSISNNSRRVFRYCATVRRRTRPFFGAGRRRATSSPCPIQSVICCFSAAVGCGWPFGGIVPARTLLWTASQTLTWLSSKCESSRSTRTPAVLLSTLWQRWQFCVKNGFTNCSNDGSEGAATDCAGEKRAVNPKAMMKSRPNAETDLNASRRSAVKFFIDCLLLI